MNTPIIDADERDFLIGYASRLEWHSRYWRWMRWMSVICLFVSMGFVSIKDRLASEIHSFDSITIQAYDISKEAGSKEISTALNDLAKNCNNRMSLLLTEYYIMIGINIIIFFGPVSFGYAAYNWNRDKRDRLMAKLLLSLAESTSEHKTHKS